MLRDHIYSPFLLALLVDVYEEDGRQEKREEAVKVYTNPVCRVGINWNFSPSSTQPKSQQHDYMEKHVYSILAIKKNTRKEEKVPTQAHIKLVSFPYCHTPLSLCYVCVSSAVVQTVGGQGRHHQEDLLGLRGQTTATTAATPLSGLRPLIGTSSHPLSVCVLLLFLIKNLVGNFKGFRVFCIMCNCEIYIVGREILYCLGHAINDVNG